MGVFYTTLFSTFFLSVFSRMSNKKFKLIEIICILSVMIIFILVAGLRSNIGDTYMYMHSYSLLANFTGFTSDMKDKGFTIFQLILYNINSDPQFFVFVTSFITQMLNIFTMALYRNYFELQIYMYFTAGYFLVTMNGIRQALAAAILFAATYLIIKGKFILYLIIVAIASTVHSSAIIMIPVYFIVRQEAWSKEMKIIIGLAAISFLFFNKLMPQVFSIMSNSSYVEYAEDIASGGNGSSFMRMIVNAVPIFLAYIKRHKLKESWPESNIFVNMSLINLIFITFALYDWIFARFTLYFELYNFVLLPYIIKECFNNRKERDLIYYGFIICYFIFFYYEQVIGGVGLGYKSNFF